MRRLTIAAIAALLLLGIGVALSQSITTTSDVQIVARELEDGRIEFGLEQDGERILPRVRYFPATAPVDRWLKSSEIAVEVGDESVAETPSPSSSVGEPMPANAIGWPAAALPDLGKAYQVNADGWTYWRTSTDFVFSCAHGSGTALWSDDGQWVAMDPFFESWVQHWIEAAHPGVGSLFSFVCAISHPGADGTGTRVAALDFAEGTYVCGFSVLSNANSYGSATNFIVRLGGSLMVNEIAEWESYERLYTARTAGAHYLEVDASGAWAVYCAPG